MELKEIEEPPHKRRKTSSVTTYKWLSEYNPFKKPSPLGLKLDKSLSVLKLIEKKLNQVNKNDDSLPSKNRQVRKKKAVNTGVVKSDHIDKLKASNFPALRLKIGDWEYVSQREGDLTAKCYFAKHKLVWEVLDGGLKNKIEIQWEDILSLKGNFPDNGPGTLTVMLGKLPQFFRESYPYPRKHTVWLPIRDFTGGEAIKFRMEHYLQCPQGVLNKHYEKLMHCDTRLKFLSQQVDTVLDKPFPEASIKAPNVSHNIVSNKPETPKVPSVDINDMVLQPTSQCHLRDADFPQKDIWKNNINSLHWQNENHYSSPEGMILWPTSRYLLDVDDAAQKDTRKDYVNGWQDDYNYSNLFCDLLSDDYWIKQGLEEGLLNVSGCKQDLGMSRKGSFSEFMSLFDDFEDDKIL